MRPRKLILIFASQALACTGTITSGGGGGGSGAGPVDPVEVTPPAPRAAGSYPWTRLTAEQYDNTIADLLLDTRRLAADGFSAEGLGTSGFASPGLVSPLDAERFDGVATELSSKISTSCTTDECAQSQLSDLATRAFRRPLTVEESADFAALFHDARTAQLLSVTDSIRLVAQAVLQSPAMLYLGEPSLTPLPLDEKREPLDDYAVASRLSYFLWGSMPDPALFTAAHDGLLKTQPQVEAQARRMLGGDKAKASWHRFVDQWLKVTQAGQLTRADPLFAPARADLLPQLHAFVDSVVAQDGKLKTLLTSPAVYVTTATAPLLGTAAPAMPLTRVDLPHRFGLLTQIAVLTTGATASEEDPIRRGKLVREAMLCQSMPAPPPNVPPLPPVSETATLRERHDQHFSVEPCKSCHTLMDPIGYGLDNYDAVGRYREQDSKGRAIDVSGTVVRLTGTESPTFVGPGALSSLLASSETVRQCVATQYLRFALSRDVETDDALGETQARDAFASTDYDMRELLVAIAASDAMRFRAPAQEPNP